MNLTGTLAQLSNVKKAGLGYSARCPAHDDTNNSLSIREGRDGRLLVYCHAGCEYGAIMDALGIKRTSGYTLADYADEKGLPVPFLHEVGVRDDEYEGRPCVSIQYPTGKRYRGPEGAKWSDKGFKAQLYGTDRLRDGGAVLVLEGESDCHVAWYQLMAAVGVPGASSWRREWTPLLDGLDVFLWREPDQGGDKLLASMASDLPNLRVIAPTNGDPKDLADLYRKHGRETRARLAEMVKAATPAADLMAELSKTDQATELRVWARTLADLDPLDRELAVREKEKELSAAGVKYANRLVRAAVRSVEPETDADGQQGTAVVLAEPVPSLEPVHGAELLDNIVAQAKRFLVLPVHAPEAVALWTVFTYTHDASSVSPLLVITSPTKQCGKTTTQEFLATLVAKPLTAANVTGAVLFRVVEKYSPCLLVDEADSFLTRSDELRGILNSGHRKATAQVVRTSGDDYEPRVFRTWCPKSLALITSKTPLPDTLADRSIPVEMRRRRKDEPVERWRFDAVLQAHEPLRRQTARWAQDHMAALREADPDVPGELSDRAADNWRSLIGIADLAGGEWPERARAAALALSGKPADDTEQVGVVLLGDLRELFDSQGTDRLPSATVAEQLAKLEGRPWPEWGRARKPITANAIARLFKPFGIKPRVLWDDDKSYRGYLRDECEDAFQRYLDADADKDTPGQGLTTVRVSDSKPDNDLADRLNRKAAADLTVAQTDGYPQKDANLTPLTVADSRVRGVIP